MLMAGGVLLAGALLADLLGISGAGFSRGQALIALVGLVLLLIGALGNRVVDAYKTVAILLLNTLVLLLLIEIGAGVVSRIISQAEDNPGAVLADPRLELSYYQEQDWSSQYFLEVAEIENLTSAYRPFTLWAAPHFSGEFLNVDESNHRVTPGAQCDEDAYTVFAFGGSTMFGVGAPDWGTIAAYVQQNIESDQPVCTVNYGQLAYVSDQSVIALMRELKRGARPDLVIFYDGTNEVLAAYQNGEAGGHLQQAQIIGLLTGTSEAEPLGDQIADELAENTYTVNLLDRWFRDDAPPPDGESGQNYRALGVDEQTLAESVVHNYLENYGIVELLAERYGFDFAFFWQPSIFRDKTLTDEEQAMIDARGAAYRDLFDATYDYAEDVFHDYANLHDLSGIFETHSELVWSDWLHLTPIGNEIIADAMLTDLP
jgi:lysophospholipase L1-like esterase